VLPSLKKSCQAPLAVQSLLLVVLLPLLLKSLMDRMLLPRKNSS
jgi:hypothetical protein